MEGVLFFLLTVLIVVKGLLGIFVKKIELNLVSSIIVLKNLDLYENPPNLAGFVTEFHGIQCLH